MEEEVAEEVAEGEEEVATWRDKRDMTPRLA